VIYPFGGIANAAEPYAGTIDGHGVLYGTTSDAGGYAYGAVYAITSGGTKPYCIPSGTTYRGGTNA